MQVLLGATIGTGYRIDREISGGNMGMVYEGTQLSVDRRVAIKVIDHERALNRRSVDRFFHEAKIISKLEHPHIVRLYDFGNDEQRDLLFLVMEFIQGPTLNELLRTHRFKQSLVIEIAIQICRALVESHDKSVVHRDLKPANILLSRMSDGSLQLKVVDFGVARALETLDKQLTAEGAICGTPRYMPPEQARHGANIDGRADLYALGLIMYEMLCGYPPFDAGNAIELIIKHIKDRPRRLSAFLNVSELLPELEQLVNELLEKRPGDRPADAIAVLRRLEDIRANYPQVGGVIRLDGRQDVYQELQHWMMPAVQEARAALVYGNTSQVDEEQFEAEELEPLETEWDHTQTVKINLAEMTLTPVRPVAKSGWVEENTMLLGDAFEELETQIKSPHHSGYSEDVNDDMSDLDGSDVMTLVDGGASLQTPAQEPVTKVSMPADRVEYKGGFPQSAPTPSDTFQSFFIKVGGGPQGVEDTSDEEDLASREDLYLAQQQSSAERLLWPVVIAVGLCVAGVIVFMLMSGSPDGDEAVDSTVEAVAGTEEPPDVEEVPVVEDIRTPEPPVVVEEDPADMGAVMLDEDQGVAVGEGILDDDMGEDVVEEPAKKVRSQTKSSRKRKSSRKKSRTKTKKGDKKQTDLDWLKSI